MKKYLVKTINYYSDGTYEEISLEKSSNDELIKKMEEIFSEPSSSRRIKINVAIYIAAKYFSDMKDDDAISHALTYVAENQQVTRATVADKSFRQLEMTASEYKLLLNDALQGKSNKLKERLKKYSGTRTHKYDIELIEKYI